MPFLFITSTYPDLSFIATFHWYIQLQNQAANCIIFSEEINTGAASARVSNGKEAREELTLHLSTVQLWPIVRRTGEGMHRPAFLPDLLSKEPALLPQAIRLKHMLDSSLAESTYMFHQTWMVSN